MEALTPKQSAFCREYLVDLNGTQAAIRAGYSPKTANEQAARLLAHVSVRSHVQKLMDERVERVARSADDVLRDLHKIKEVNMRETDDGEMVNSSAALKALELEGRHIGMWVDKVEHSGKIGLEQLIAGGE